MLDWILLIPTLVIAAVAYGFVIVIGWARFGIGIVIDHYLLSATILVLSIAFVAGIERQKSRRKS